MGDPMTVADLRALLTGHGVIRPDAYCLTGGLPNEAYAIERIGSGWRVYYSEGGERRDVREFSTESVACGDLLFRLLRDPSTR